MVQGAFGRSSDQVVEPQLPADLLHGPVRNAPLQRGECRQALDVGATTPKLVAEWLKAGLQHFVVRVAHPFDTKAVERLIKIRDS